MSSRCDSSVKLPILLVLILGLAIVMLTYISIIFAVFHGLIMPAHLEDNGVSSVLGTRLLFIYLFICEYLVRT